MYYVQHNSPWLGNAVTNSSVRGGILIKQYGQLLLRLWSNLNESFSVLQNWKRLQIIVSSFYRITSLYCTHCLFSVFYGILYFFMESKIVIKIMLAKNFGKGFYGAWWLCVWNLDHKQRGKVVGNSRFGYGENKMDRQN